MSTGITYAGGLSAATNGLSTENNIIKLGGVLVENTNINTNDNDLNIQGVNRFFYNNVGVATLNDITVDAENGLTNDSGVVKLGGQLTENTEIDLNTNQFNIIGENADFKFNGKEIVPYYECVIAFRLFEDELIDKIVLFNTFPSAVDIFIFLSATGLIVVEDLNGSDFFNGDKLFVSTDLNNNDGASYTSGVSYSTFESSLYQSSFSISFTNSQNGNLSNGGFSYQSTYYKSKIRILQYI